MDKYSFTDCVDIVGNACAEFTGEKAYISTGAVNEDHINQSEVEMVDYLDKPSRANLSVETGDILFAKMQATRKTLYVTEELSKNIYSTGFFAVRPHSNVLTSKCLFYLLTSKTFLNQKDKYCSGATQKAITNSGLQKILITLPPIDQQNRISEQLDLISETIKTKTSELKKFDDLVKARFVEMFGDPTIEEGRWRTKKLTDLGKFKNGMNFHQDDSGVKIRCLGVGDFKDNNLITDMGLLPYIALSSQPADDYLLRDEDIVFVRSNGNKALVGRSVQVFPKDIPVTFSGFCIRYRLDSTEVMSRYLLEQLKIDSVRQQMAGRGANIQNLNQQILSNINVSIPPIEMQKKYVNFVQQVDKSKVAVHVL